jgi:hypothetical protein
MVSMVNVAGHEYFGMIVPYNQEEASVLLSFANSGFGSEQSQILISTANADVWNYEILSVTGQVVSKGALQVGKDLTRLFFGQEIICRGKYFFRAINSKGQVFVLPVEKN